MATSSGGTLPDSNTPSSEQRKIFRHFDLPREMRDEIYTHMLGDKSFTTPNGFDYKAVGIADTSHLTISRQFHQELLEIESKNFTLEMADCMDLGWKESMNCWKNFTPRMRRTRSLHAKVVVDCVDTTENPYIDDTDDIDEITGDFDMRGHIRWINRLLVHLPQLEKLSIEAVVLYKPDVEKLKRIWKTSGLMSKNESSMELKFFEFLGNDWWGSKEQNNTVLRWSHANDRLESVKKIEDNPESAAA